MIFCVPIPVIICWFVIRNLTSASPVFDPFNPNQQENFDPAQGDPKGNITCLGEAYDLALPISNGFNPNGISMQKLCAKTQYGGGPPNQNIGGFCYYLNSTTLNPQVVFDQSLEAQANTELANPRVMLGCAYRCFCNYRVNNTSIQPKLNPAVWKFHMASDQTYYLQIDVNDKTDPPFYQKIGPFGNHRVDSLGLDSRHEIRGNDIAPWAWTELSLDPGNLIECYGDLPSFDPPSPFSRLDFRNVQHMCAMALSHGNAGANAGGYCHRSVTSQGPKNTVWFSDELTPRHEWTWAGGNLRFVASLRWHCSRVCSCYEDPSHDNITTNVWRVLENLKIMDQDRSLYLISKAIDSRTQILPPQTGSNPPSGTCGASGTEFCPLDWDFKAWGPVPTAPVGTTNEVKPQAPGPNPSVCGNKCQRLSDCGSTNDQYNCSCAVPTMTDIRNLGLDPVAPVAICIALFASSIKSNSLNGRNIPKFTDFAGMPHVCKCNATFTSDECCVPNVKKSVNASASKYQRRQHQHN